MTSDTAPAPLDRSGSLIDHLNIAVPDLAAVDRFHRTALAHGATELEAPAVRPGHHADHHGGFVLDTHGINLEAVCHAAP